MKTENSIRTFVQGLNFIECRQMLINGIGQEQIKDNHELFEKAYAASVIMTFLKMEIYKSSPEFKNMFMEWRKKFNFQKPN